LRKASSKYLISWFCQMMSVCRPHPDKIAHWAILYGRCLRMRLDPDTDDKNSTNVIQLVLFWSGYRCADTNTYTEMWNSGLILLSVVLYNVSCYAFFPVWLKYIPIWQLEAEVQRIQKHQHRNQDNEVHGSALPACLTEMIMLVSTATPMTWDQTTG